MPSGMGTPSWRWCQECSEGNKSGYWPKFPFLYLLLLEDTKNWSSHHSSRWVFLRSYSPCLLSLLRSVTSPSNDRAGRPFIWPCPRVAPSPTLHNWPPCSRWALMTAGLDSLGAHQVRSSPSRKPRKEETPSSPTVYSLLSSTAFPRGEFGSRCLPLLFLLAWSLNPLSHWLTLSSLLLNWAPALPWPLSPL